MRDHIYIIEVFSGILYCNNLNKTNPNSQLIISISVLHFAAFHMGVLQQTIAAVGTVVVHLEMCNEQAKNGATWFARVFRDTKAVALGFN